MTAHDSSSLQPRGITPTQRAALVVLWLASAVLVYFLGASTNSPPPIDSDARPSAAPSDASPPKSAGLTDESDAADPSRPKTLEDIFLPLGKAIAGGVMDQEILVDVLEPLLALRKEQIPEALAAAEKLGLDDYSMMLVESTLTERWAKFDGRAAVEFALAKPRVAGLLAATAMSTWARSDSEAAWKWFQSAGKLQHEPSLAQSLFTGMAGVDVDGALSRLPGLDPLVQQAALRGIADSVKTAESRMSLLARAGTLPEAARDMLFTTLIQRTKPGELDSTLQWIRSLPAEQQSAARDVVAQSFFARVQKQPAKILEFRLETATPEQVPKIYAEVIYYWLEADPKAATERMETLPPGPEYDSARHNFALSMSRTDPQAALPWANRIQDLDKRTAAVANVIVTWHAKDPVAAEAALKASGLPADRIAQTLLKLQPPPPPSLPPGFPPR